MSSQTEKIFKELNKAVAEHGEFASKEEAEKFINEFMNNHNENLPEPLTEKTAKSAEDYLELADQTVDEARRLKYIKQARKIDPDNLDAELEYITYTAKDDLDCLKKLKSAVGKGNQIMKKEGYMDDDIGHFWGVVETRPYMRLREAYLEYLNVCGIKNKAIEEGKELLRLCENDNIGVRFTLMHLYAEMLMEEEATALLERYPDDGAEMQLPYSLLYFRLFDLGKAERILKELAKNNSETKLFFRAYFNDTLKKHIEKMNYGYRPGTIEELIDVFMNNIDVYKSNPVFMEWAYSVLR